MKTCRWILLLACAALTACSSAEQARETDESVAAARAIGGIIVKPKTAISDEASLMKLVSAHLRHPNQVQFLRAMSGGAYVLSVYPPAIKADIATIVAQLGSSGLFEYVEEDQMMTIQR